MTSPWKFFIINPLDKNPRETTQELYTQNYNDSYNDFIKSLCIPQPNDLLKDITVCGDNCFIFFINCEGDNDIINKNSDFEFKFLKSKFLEYRFIKIKDQITNYYMQFGITINNMFKDGNNYIFELVK
jgi:hypothetical protein